ncbi:Gfo/Idh/MocA family oxidoreductase [bacterium M00.F.Ca.ET.228.01.1.1]|uniref:Gfo/Idh/MocA family protein n=1 Tax=Paraburkholderia phenoliruptrix TaxID=252970 RepID=UPI001092477F|nr:Gfo/Idh/MocA family oxidoreductase [Paraburkholderia phenoliruptrix]TGP43180.1 Gfo/Idh/MocA family oxidoreductase [bacterium M00.F.Ca.ET.228.01.1.1]TGS00618.1 Gfo/Idh/MocA family oxidoreductase [bacterium M00.F.Ca.ET.191.01.1.1]TGU05004.1 Gfo/Idh/MocA family oxidoreductase [bacterium M00.F.Ca.ET.155.01.1.1]MBW0446886.1 Gfo/Idh/MocA family oxidoreductase [Paraburkholderia phenoliruptrix]MBW9099382.1 Gfo/Idh/MocA family oxidoreductase [Paraburkholderia phenoliruptrix]
MPYRRLRLGMVGGGQGAFIGSVHRLAARLDDRFELAAGALSSDPQRARASAAEAGIARSYDDWREMARAEAAREDGIDAVAIVTPNHLHAPVATAFLEAGIHVVCDKPLAVSLAEGEALAKLAREKNRLFALTHTYSGYPLVRHAREMIEAGEIGQIRVVQVEYAQDWLAEPVENGGLNKQAGWRTDPALAGPAGCLGDIGTHAYHLASFVTGMTPVALSAELHTFVPGRRIDDHAQAMLRYANGARGMLWASQVASGAENALRLRVYGTRASLAFDQEQPNELWFTPLGGAAQRLTRARVSGPSAAHATRVPAGHPEGYLEAFAQLYKDAALQIEALNEGRALPAESLLLTTVEDGVAGLRFIDAMLASSAADGQWREIAR